MGEGPSKCITAHCPPAPANKLKVFDMTSGGEAFVDMRDGCVFHSHAVNRKMGRLP